MRIRRWDRLAMMLVGVLLAAKMLGKTPAWNQQSEGRRLGI